MAMPAWVAETWNALSEDRKKQAGDFLKVLLSEQREEQKPPSSFPFGILRGKIEVADNFDDPLPEFEDYT